MNLAASIEEAVRQFPELPAIADGTISLSYREFHARAMALVHFFKREGIRPGDRIAIRLPNVTDVMTLAYATWWAGAVFVPLNTRFSAVDLAEIVKDVEPRYLVLPEHDKQLLPLTQLPGFTTVLWAEQSSDTPQHLNHIVAQNREPSLWEPMEPRKDTDPALIMYTSGTTGRPKGVIQTHRNNTAAIQMLGNTWQVTRHDRFLVSVPLFHVGGMQTSTLPALALGAQVTLVPHLACRRLDKGSSRVPAYDIRSGPGHDRRLDSLGSDPPGVETGPIPSPNGPDGGLAHLACGSVSIPCPLWSLIT